MTSNLATTSSDEAISRPDLSDTQALRTALGLAGTRTGKVPAELLVRQCLEAYRNADWQVRRTAVEVVLRRFEIARREKLRVAERPKGWQGVYRTRRPRQPVRPYHTLLRSVDPLVGSCDCADFVTNAVGLCKHLVAVLQDVARRPRVWQRAVREGAGEPQPRLRWDPITPLLSDTDWLLRVWVEGGLGEGARWRALRPFLRTPRGGTTGPRHDLRPERRLALVRAIGALVRLDRRAVPSDPALVRLAGEEAERLERGLELQRALPRLRRTLTSLKRRCYAYQREGVERFLASGRLVLADDMGLGKTTQAVACCHALWHAGLAERGLVVVPASLKPQWLQEWRACSDAPIALLEGTPDERRELLGSHRRGFLLVNYELLLRDIDAVAAWGPAVVVLDEAQRIKNWATRTAAVVKRLRPPWRLVLTGTPFENRVAELDSILEWVDRRPMEPTWRVEPLHFRAPSEGDAGGMRHVDVLRARLAPVLLRRRRAEILRQLPPRTDTRVAVELTPAQREEHDALYQPIATLARISEQRPLTQPELLRLMMLLNTQRVIANGMAQLQFQELWPGLATSRAEPPLLQTLGMPKLLELRELVDRIALEQERKVVVFSQWRRALQLGHWACRPALAEGNVRAVFFTGRESTRARERNLVAFHDDPETRLLFATDAGGVGLNLQKAATCCVQFELPWNPAVFEQRVGRIYRLGQKRPIDVYTLVSTACIEERIAQLVANKAATFHGLFDSDGNEVRFERQSGFLAGVRELVRSEPAAADSEGTEDGTESRDEESVGSRRQEASVERVVAAADEATDAAVGADPEATTPADVAALLGQVAVTHTPGGGLRLEAPPQAADALAALFRGVADMLARGSAPAPIENR